MFKRILLFTVANFLFSVVVIAIYGIGYEYDKAHRIYPESKLLSYDVSMQVYGERWVRFAKIMFVVGLLANGAILMNCYRNRNRNNGDRVVSVLRG
jgi:hypothetical protein